jgi:hypothetical protein
MVSIDGNSVAVPLSKIGKVLPTLLGAAALGSWLVSVALGLQYDKTRPTVAQPNEGRIYCFSNHEHVVFLTAREKLQWNILVGTAVCFFLTGTVLVSFQRRQQPK